MTGIYSSPDSFGSTPSTAPRLVDPMTGIAWTLGFGAYDANGVPAVIWIVVATWSVAKSRLGPTWADAKRAAQTWGIAKSLVAS